MHIRILILSLFLISNLGVGQTCSIKGYASDSVSGEILIAADVFLKNTSFKTKTDIDGFFMLDSVPSGNYVLRVSYLGFKTKERHVVLTNNDSLVCEIQLNPAPQILIVPELIPRESFNY